MARRLRGRPLAAVVPIGIGHNNGPPMATRWGAYCWRRAHGRAWQPPGPEVIRLRLRRAAELGLDYRQFASILMEAGRTPTAVVFVLPVLQAPGTGERLREIDRPKLLAVGVAASTAEALAGLPRDVAARIKGCRVAAEARDLPAALLSLLSAHAVQPGAALLVGGSAGDRDLMVRARLAAFLDADAYFGRTAKTPQTKGLLP